MLLHYSFHLSSLHLIEEKCTLSFTFGNPDVEIYRGRVRFGGGDSAAVTYLSYTIDLLMSEMAAVAAAINGVCI